MQTIDKIIIIIGIIIAIISLLVTVFACVKVGARADKTEEEKKKGL